MAAVMPKEGRLWAHEMINWTPGAGTEFELRLFISNTFPDADTELADLTEASYEGYMGQTVTFPGPAINGAGKASKTAAEKTFQPMMITGPQTIYGWFLKPNSPNVIAFIERFAAPRVLEADSDQIKITLTLTVTEDS